MDEKLIYSIRTLYDQRVLTPRFGEGSLKKDLLDGLEGVLKDVDVAKDIPKSAIENQILDRKIDYGAIKNLALRLYHGAKYSTNTTTRLMHLFFGEKIETYRDLVNYAKDQHRKGKLKNMNGVRVLKIRNMGPRVSTLLYIHLNSLGINLFSDSYRPQELGKHG